LHVLSWRLAAGGLTQRPGPHHTHFTGVPHQRIPKVGRCETLHTTIPQTYPVPQPPSFATHLLTQLRHAGQKITPFFFVLLPVTVNIPRSFFGKSLHLSFLLLYPAFSPPLLLRVLPSVYEGLLHPFANDPTYLPTSSAASYANVPSHITRTQSPAKPSDPTNAPVSADLLLAARHVYFQQWLRLLSPLRVWEESAGQGYGA